MSETRARRRRPVVVVTSLPGEARRLNNAADAVAGRNARRDAAPPSRSVSEAQLRGRAAWRSCCSATTCCALLAALGWLVVGVFVLALRLGAVGTMPEAGSSVCWRELHEQEVNLLYLDGIIAYPQWDVPPVAFFAFVANCAEDDADGCKDADSVNAVLSWRYTHPDNDVFLFGGDTAKRVASAAGVVFVPLKVGGSRQPASLAAMVKAVHHRSPHTVLAMMDPRVVMTRDLNNGLRALCTSLGPEQEFLLFGSCHGTHASAEQEEKLADVANATTSDTSPSFVVFSRHLWPRGFLPPTPPRDPVPVTTWQWMVRGADSLNAAVVDATPATTCFQLAGGAFAAKQAWTEPPTALLLRRSWNGRGSNLHLHPLGVTLRGVQHLLGKSHADAFLAALPAMCWVCAVITAAALVVAVWRS